MLQKEPFAVVKKIRFYFICFLKEVEKLRTFTPSVLLLHLLLNLLDSRLSPASCNPSGPTIPSPPPPAPPCPASPPPPPSPPSHSAPCLSSLP